MPSRQVVTALLASAAAMLPNATFSDALYVLSTGSNDYRQYVLDSFLGVHQLTPLQLILSVVSSIARALRVSRTAPAGNHLQSGLGNVLLWRFLCCVYCGDSPGMIPLAIAQFVAVIRLQGLAVPFRRRSLPLVTGDPLLSASRRVFAE